MLATWVRSVRCMYSGGVYPAATGVWVSDKNRGTQKTPRNDQSSMTRVRFQRLPVE